MSPYEVIFHAKASQEVVGLPAHPSRALYEVLAAISRSPWESTDPDKLTGDPTFRFAKFDQYRPGRYLGLVQVRINDQARIVTVHGVSWLG